MTGQGTSPGLVATLIAAAASTDYLAGYTPIGASSTWTRTGTGSVWLTAPTNGGVVNIKAAVWAPSGSSWTHSFEIGCAIAGASSSVGMIVRDSVSGRCLIFAVDAALATHIYRVTLTTFVADSGTTSSIPAALAPTMWLTVVYNGTTLAWYAGYALGDRAISLGSETVATYLAVAPDQVGVYQDPYNGTVSAAVADRMSK